MQRNVRDSETRRSTLPLRKFKTGKLDARVRSGKAGQADGRAGEST